MGEWYAVDLDKTLARYDSGQGIDTIGEPIAPMLNRVRLWLDGGKDVRIFTARVAGLGSSELEDREEALRQSEMIEDWCQTHLGTTLRITSRKDYEMVELWDDRAITVLPNLGIPLDEMDTIMCIESDATVTSDGTNITVCMMTGNDEDQFEMTPREALVLAARLLRATQSVEP